MESACPLVPLLFHFPLLREAMHCHFPMQIKNKGYVDATRAKKYELGLLIKEKLKVGLDGRMGTLRWGWAGNQAEE